MCNRTPILVIGLSNKNVQVFDLRKPSQPIVNRGTPLRHQLRCMGVFPSKDGFAVGSIEGRCAVQMIDDGSDGNNNNNSNSNNRNNDSFSFKCHRHPANSIHNRGGGDANANANANNNNNNNQASKDVYGSDFFTPYKKVSENSKSAVQNTTRAANRNRELNKKYINFHMR